MTQLQTQFQDADETYNVMFPHSAVFQDYFKAFEGKSLFTTGDIRLNSQIEGFIEKITAVTEAFIKEHKLNIHVLSDTNFNVAYVDGMRIETRQPSITLMGSRKNIMRLLEREIPELTAPEFDLSEAMKKAFSAKTSSAMPDNFLLKVAAMSSAQALNHYSVAMRSNAAKPTL